MRTNGVQVEMAGVHGGVGWRSGWEVSRLGAHTSNWERLELGNDGGGRKEGGLRGAGDRHRGTGVVSRSRIRDSDSLRRKRRWREASD